MYKVSKYNIKIKENDGKLYIFNAFKGIDDIRYIESDHAIYDVFSNSSPIFDETQFSKDDIETLKNHGLIVDESEDEIQKAMFYLDEMIHGETLCLTILTTRNCNFRCKYCYEKFENRDMTRDIADIIALFVSKEIRKYSALHVSWFGGEPLMNVGVIEYLSSKFVDICKSLKKTFTADITTNGYLLDIHTFRKMLESRVTKYQITIDGTKCFHDSARVLENGKGTFDHIIDNLNDIKKNVISGRFAVVVRGNIGKTQIEAIPDFVRFYEDLFGDDARFSFFLRTVSYLGGGEEVFNKNIHSITDYHSRDTIFNRTSESLKTLRLDTNYGMLRQGGCVCYASLKNHMVIDYDGTIRKCTCSLDDEKNKIGHLTEGGEKCINYSLINKWTEEKPKNKCINCCFFPICFGKNCPANDVYKRNDGCPYERLEIKPLIKGYITTNTVGRLLAK